MLRIREERIKAGLTQQELAHLAGISIRTMQNLETNGRDPRVGTVRRVADALGVPFSLLLEKAS
jgi:HTH-type transcriptional regulator, competence development regulator